MSTCRALVSVARLRVVCLLLTLSLFACSSQDAVLLSLRTQSGVAVQTYDLQIQDRASRTIVYHSNEQHLAAGRDLSTQPLRLGLKLSQPGSYLLFVRAANGELQTFVSGAQRQPELFFAALAQVQGSMEMDALLLEVMPNDDLDGDHFPDAQKWLSDSGDAAALYRDHPEVLDCVDDPKKALPDGLHAADINPIAVPRCGLSVDTSCGSGAPACIDADGDGDPEGSDCDDHDPRRFHGNPHPRNCCVCTDRQSCATNHQMLADLSLCTPPRCRMKPGDTVLDYDCTGQVTDCFIDEDCDGYAANDPVPSQRDCDDHDPNVHPGAAKNCADPSKDWACDGNPRGGCVACDLDGDGFQRQDPQNSCPDPKTDAHPGMIDCNDNDRGVFPGSTGYDSATLIVHDLNGREGGSVAGALRGLCRNRAADGSPQDADCNGQPWQSCPPANCDADGDGFPSKKAGCNPNNLPVDCDDNDPHTFPGAPDYCGDGIPQNCVSDHPCDNDGDGDHYNKEDDCDDTDPQVHPWSMERCNGKDDDCDGLVDELNPDPDGKPLVESHQVNGQTVSSIASCTDSNVGSCAQTVPASGGYTGRCVCTGEVPNSTRDQGGNYTKCQGQTDDKTVTPKCFGAYQPYQPNSQTCDADHPMDEDCDGRTDAPDGLRLKEYGNACGVKVGACVPGTVIGCDHSKLSPFYTFQSLGFPASQRFLLCDPKTTTFPTAEVCNGIDDDCNGKIPGQGSATPVAGDEADHDKDLYLACTGCDPKKLAKGLLGCNDCNDLDPTIYPGAPELCDGKDNKCVGAGFNVNTDDGKDDCQDAVVNTCCQGPPMCIDPMTNFKHCGTCANACSLTTADKCSGGKCMCAGDPQCSAGKPLCKAGVGCVQCLGDGDCPAGTPHCNNKNACVQCLADGDCGAGKYCDGTGTCQACTNDPNHCGPMCMKCAAGTPKCNGTACVQCLADGDCGAGMYCDGTGTCQACTNDPNHCGPMCMKCMGMTPKCNGAACVQCLADGDCGAGVYCDGANTCQTCNVNAHCGAATCYSCVNSAEPTCSNQVCTCAMDMDCSAGDTCNNMTHMCMHACAMDMDCAAAAQGKVCVGATSCGCGADADCNTANPKCMTNVCMCGGTQCKAGQTCNNGACM